MNSAWTLLELVREAAAYLARKGISSPRLDAELLMAHVLGCGRVDLYLRFDQPVAQGELDRFRELLLRRGKREPVAYILGNREFWSLGFRVNPKVLIPRPETETLVELALGELRRAVGEGPLPVRALELGTGCGAVAIALARELGPSVSWVATDISREALDVARCNARELGVEALIQFLEGDLWDPLDPEGRQFRLILSNPPYVPTSCIERLEPEISCYEPRQALDGGQDGLVLVRRILEGAPLRLDSKGMLLMELGEGQSQAVEGILGRDRRWRRWGWGLDLGGRPRVLWASVGEM
jgi:release factor glutamine methyltransferase